MEKLKTLKNALKTLAFGTVLSGLMTAEGVKVTSTGTVGGGSITGTVSVGGKASKSVVGKKLTKIEKGTLKEKLTPAEKRELQNKLRKLKPQDRQKFLKKLKKGKNRLTHKHRCRICHKLAKTKGGICRKCRIERNRSLAEKAGTQKASDKALQK